MNWTWTRDDGDDRDKTGNCPVGPHCTLNAENTSLNVGEAVVLAVAQCKARSTEYLSVPVVRGEWLKIRSSTE